jgi:branched-chain amino acid aminotransferase
VTRVVSIDGEIVPPERATVSVFDRGFLYGDGIFESLRVYAGRPFALTEHLARLGRSAAALGIPLPIPLAGFAHDVQAAISASGEAEAYVRIMLTRGTSDVPSLMPAGPLTATRVILVEPLRLPPRQPYASGVTAITLRWDAWTAPASAKVIPYLTSLLALQEAKVRGAAEAIFVDRGGLVREAATANVFAVMADGRLVTPSEGPGVLGGITRGQVLDLAVTLGLSCSVSVLELEALARAQEVFLTSSIREVVSVVAVDGAAIGAGTPGQVARTLHSALRVRAGASGPSPWE